MAAISRNTQAVLRCVPFAIAAASLFVFGASPADALSLPIGELVIVIAPIVGMTYLLRLLRD